ncbi:MAG: hypothetical protein IPP74_10315 [Alphaproteobacteria bacterium]|nr:hypothetical protein [Alphaproteobacteria bacterium]
MSSIHDLVKGWLDVLKGLDQPGLNEWAKRQGLDNKGSFIQFKKALLQHGIDYNALRNAYHAERANQLAAICTHELTLITDADKSLNRYAVCDGHGGVLWHGKFFEHEPATQFEAEIEAAKKALWLAGKVKERIGAQGIRLTIKLDAEWLSFQGDVLKGQARKNNIELHMINVPGVENPADKWTTETGFKKWQENDLSILAFEIQG